MRELEKELLRKAAVKLVDSMHKFKAETVLLCGTSSQIAFSLIAEAWRRRHPNTPLPSVRFVSVTRPQDVQGKKVVLFDEIFSTGRSLREAEEIIARFKPREIKKIALIHGYRPVPDDIETGGHLHLVTTRDVGYEMRSKLKQHMKWSIGHGIRTVEPKPENRELARRIAKEIREKRKEFRRIASTIEPRKK